ncbi:23S rRNA (Uracil-5-)-methyltransferase [Gracilaria domingensis]|nr:23S rRNA (Uracil-5-)-methyltransferase [Gracilaria domingensis]
MPPSTFIAPLPVNVSRRHAATLCSQRAPTCSASAEPRKATLFTTGKKLLLHRESDQVQPEPNVPRFIVCPQCSFAYAGNALNALTTVRCPHCTNVFQVAPSELFVAAASAVSAAPVELPKDRVLCSHMDSCSGCSLSTLAKEPPVLNEVRSFLSRYGIKALSVQMESVHHWRTHAKLAIRSPNRSPIMLGLFKSNSHDLQQIPACTVHAPEINAAAALIQKTLRDSNLRAYNERTGGGHCRYALFSVHRSSRKVQVTIVWNASSWKDANPEATTLAAEIWRRGQNLLHSLWFNWNMSSGNTITCPEVERFYLTHGQTDLIERVCDVSISFPPYAFRQANLDAFEKLVLPELLSYIPIGANVAEFCAGVGIIGLAALKHRRLTRLSSSEIMDGGQKAFWAAYNQLRRDGVKGNAAYIIGSDSDTVDMVQPDTQVVIVDPPRGGLSEDVVEFLASPRNAHSLSRLVYLSCGFSAFKKDARQLLEGQWYLKTAHAFILFPGSNHVELLCIFDRKRSRDARYNSRRDTRRRDKR